MPKYMIRFGVKTSEIIDTGRVKDFGYHMTYVLRISYLSIWETHLTRHFYAFLFFDKRSGKTI